ncbi:MAG TPA: hypothetical protein DIW81_11920 [Planctomycetaceae bacterium]|nr:hypothetical protein [Planctomycetaceae bacterium]
MHLVLNLPMVPNMLGQDSHLWFERADTEIYCCLRETENQLLRRLAIHCSFAIHRPIRVVSLRLGQERRCSVDIRPALRLIPVSYDAERCDAESRTWKAL